MGTGIQADPLRVLLVDDDEEDYLLTRSYLNEIAGRHYVLDWLSDYDEALLRICQRGYDVYLIDYRLGARDGLTLIQDALQRGCIEPMILLTGQGQFETDLAAMQAGAADYLEKSHLDATRLERTIRYACLQKRLESELEAKVHERTQALEAEIQARCRVEEQLREENQRKNEFLAILGHELRNPLMPISNALAILRMSGQTAPPAEKAIEILERQVQVMVRLIDDLLDIGRITNGRLRLEMDTVRLAEILHSALEISRIPLERAGVRWSLEVPADLPVITGDAVRLSQVFANLLNNAAKFTPPGGEVTIRAGVEEAAPGVNCLAVRVRDTGVGMLPEQLSDLFQLFTQETRSLNQTRDGLGVGLALVRGLVELHNGSVTAHSDGLGRGTEFIVRLPVVLTPPATG